MNKFLLISFVIFFLTTSSHAGDGSGGMVGNGGGFEESAIAYAWVNPDQWLLYTLKNYPNNSQLNTIVAFYKNLKPEQKNLTFTQRLPNNESFSFSLKNGLAVSRQYLFSVTSEFITPQEIFAWAQHLILKSFFNYYKYNTPHNLGAILAKYNNQTISQKNLVQWGRPHIGIMILQEHSNSTVKSDDIVLKDKDKMILLKQKLKNFVNCNDTPFITKPLRFHWNRPGYLDIENKKQEVSLSLMLKYQCGDLPEKLLDLEVYLDIQLLTQSKIDYNWWNDKNIHASIDEPSIDIQTL